MPTPSFNTTFGGIFQEGQTFSALTVFDPDGSGLSSDDFTITYTWDVIDSTDDTTVIGGLTQTTAKTGATNLEDTFDLVDGTGGEKIRLTIRYENAAEGFDVTAVSGLSSIIDDLPSGSVTFLYDDGVGGTTTNTAFAKQDNEWSVDLSGLVDANGLTGATYTVVWYNSSDVAIGTGLTYTPDQDEVDDAMYVKVSYIDDNGFGNVFTSAATTTVADANDAPTAGTVTFNTTTSTEGTVITIDSVSITDIDGDGLGGTTFELGDMTSWRWMRGATEITGLSANSLTYTLSAADVGETITVEFTYDDYAFTNTYDSAGFSVTALSSNRAGGATVVGDRITVAETTLTEYQGVSASLTETQDGGTVVVWSQDDNDLPGENRNIYIRILDKTGYAHDIDFTDHLAATSADVKLVQVNTIESSHDVLPKVAVLANGLIFVTWTSYSGTDGNGSGIAGRLFTYDASTRELTAVGDEFTVNTTVTGYQTFSSVYALASGGAVVVWSDNDNGSVRWQKFDSDGAADGVEVQLGSGKNHFLPEFAELSGGGSVVVYYTSVGEVGTGASDNGIFAYVYDDNDVEIAAIQINEGDDHVVGDQVTPHVVALTNGGFAVTWVTEGAQDGGNSGLYVRTYDALGAAVSGVIKVNSFVPGNQEDYHVIALSGGGFYVVWVQENIEAGATTGQAIYGQRFDNDGVAVGAQTFLVEIDAVTDVSVWYDTNARPFLTEMDGGGLLLTYGSNIDDGIDPDTGVNVYAHRIDITGTSRAGNSDLAIANKTTGSKTLDDPGDDITYKFSVTGSYETGSAVSVSFYFVAVPSNGETLAELVADATAIRTVTVGDTTEFGWETFSEDFTRAELITALGGAADTEAGFLIAVADAAGTTNERSETNNITDYVRIALGDVDSDLTDNEGLDNDGGQPVTNPPGSGATIWPDITLWNFAVDDSTPSEGEDITINVSIRNEGLADASSIITNIYWSATEIFDFDAATHLGSVTHTNVGALDFDLDSELTIDFDTVEALGDGFLFAYTNNDPTAEEQNFGYNLSQPVEIDFYAPGTMGNLKFNGVTYNSTALDYGDDMYITVELENDGFFRTFPCTISVYWMSAGAVSFDVGSAVLLTTEGFGSLNVGETESESIRVRYETLEAQGDGKIFVVIDQAGALYEEDTGDNTSSGQSFTVAPDPADADPNLRVTSLTSDDNVLEEDEDFFLRLAVDNNGDGSSGQTTSTTLYWTETSTFNALEAVEVEGHGTLDAGESKVESIRIRYEDLQDASGGLDGYIHAFIDANDDISETNENDNKASIQYTFDATAGTINLRALSLTSGDTDLSEDEDFFLTLTVDNNGTDDSGQTVGTTFFWNDIASLDGSEVELDFEGHGTLDPGETKIEGNRLQYDDIIAASGGAGGFIIARIDDEEEVTETSEADNTVSIAFTVSATSVEPDLIVAALTTGDDTLSDGEDLFVNMTAENQGTGDASSSTTTYYWSEDATWDIGDTAIGSEPHGSLDAGESQGESTRLRYEDIAAAAVDSDGFVIAYIDATDDIDEGTNENNNTRALAVELDSTTPAQPDLVISAFATGDSQLSEDEHLDVTLTAHNQGAGDADQSETTYYWSTDGTTLGAVLGTEGHSSLDGGESDFETTRLRWDDIFAASGGTDGFVVAKIDADDDITESNDGNNTASIAVTFDLTAATDADLQITSISVDDTTLDEDDDVTVTIDVTNAGGTDARGTQTTFYWSSDATFDGGDTQLDTDGHGTLDAGETKGGERERIDYDDILATGDSEGYIIAVIDANDTIEEGANEGNNTAVSAKITVVDTTPADADLVIDDITVADDTLSDGEDFFVYLNVTNSGGTDAPGVRTQIYFSTDDSSATPGDDVALDVDNHGLLRAGETEGGERTRIRYEDVEAYAGTTGYIYAVIDDSGSVGESNEGNNASVTYELTIL